MNPAEHAALVRERDEALAERDRLRETVCATPGVAQCARMWEADHQRIALSFYGLAEEFPYSCDAITHVAAALVACRAELDRLREVMRDAV